MVQELNEGDWIICRSLQRRSPRERCESESSLEPGRVCSPRYTHLMESVACGRFFKDLGENGIVTLVRCPKDYSQQAVCLEARLYSYDQGRPAEGG